MRLSEDQYANAKEFLEKCRPYLKTKECTFMSSAKNTEFNRRARLKDEDKIRIIEKLTADDCVKIEKNNNSNYPDAMVYVFIVEVELDDVVKLYIKMYLLEEKNCAIVIVISFHNEGVFE